MEPKRVLLNILSGPTWRWFTPHGDKQTNPRARKATVVRSPSACRSGHLGTSDGDLSRSRRVSPIDGFRGTLLACRRGRRTRRSRFESDSRLNNGDLLMNPTTLKGSSCVWSSARPLLQVLAASLAVAGLTSAGAVGLETNLLTGETQTKTVVLTEGTNMAAAASPDGRTLVLAIQGVLWTLPAGGGAATRLTAWDIEATSPVWSPGWAPDRISKLRGRRLLSHLGHRRERRQCAPADVRRARPSRALVVARRAARSRSRPIAARPSATTSGPSTP